MAGSGTKKLRIVDMAYIALFAALMAVCSWISIPATVPFTLQTFAIFAALGLLGGKRGTVAVAVYLLLGAIGVPVFAGFQGGIGALLGTTGGYLLGFLLSALIVWGMEARFGSKTGVFLLSAVLDTDVDSTSHRMLLQGEIPSPIDAPAGCRFCTRCPYASDECRTVAPALREVESGHQVACHRVAQEKCPACP